jgi:CRISPR-associated protein Cmr5
MTLPVKQSSNVSLQRGLAQERARAAYGAVIKIADHHPSLSEAYKQLARSAPADVQSNGLGETLAFWQAKQDEEKLRLFEDVSNWLRGMMGFEQNLNALQWIVLRASSEEYRRAKAESIDLLIWIKRFAEGTL